jgi:AcrR family transcriptional regulator
MAETLQTGSAADTTDPRILRSRAMLMESLHRLLARKEFNDISIQEIADEAGLNRATFYLHYSDKNALLQAMTDARFRSLIERRGLTFSNCNGAIRAIALGICDYLATTSGCPTQLNKMSLEDSIIPAVERIFRDGSAYHQAPPEVNAELLATIAAWAIFGAVRHWYETPDRMPAEEMATRIEDMVKPIFFSAGG